MSERTSGYTPGPWQAGHLDWIHGKEKWKVARVFTRNPEMGFPDAPEREEAEANARLIAAAPDLLDELRETATLLQTITEDLSRIASPTVIAAIHRRIKAARAALTRATS